MDDRIKKPYEFDLQKLFETVGNKETDFDSFVNYQFEADMKKISTISELDFILKNLKEWLVKGISRSREMGKYCNMVLVTWFVMMLCCSTAWATSFEDDFQVESEAQNDMLAYVQSTFPHRFGIDLQAGDYVRYEIADHHSQREEPELCSLEVTERIANVATIKEEFEGNILYYRIDLQSNTLLEYWGYDEDGIEQRPSLLSSSEVESRMLNMKSQNGRSSNSNLPEGIAKPVFSSLAQRENFSLGRSSLNCFVRALDVPVVEGITPDFRQAVQELTKVYFSEAVPKLLPAKLMAAYLDNPEVFDGNAGLVKQSKYHIKDYNLVER